MICMHQIVNHFRLFFLIMSLFFVNIHCSNGKEYENSIVTIAVRTAESENKATQK